MKDENSAIVANTAILAFKIELIPVSYSRLHSVDFIEVDHDDIVQDRR